MTRTEALCILACALVVTYVYRHPQRVELACPPSTVIHEPIVCKPGLPCEIVKEGK